MSYVKDFFYGFVIQSTKATHHGLYFFEILDILSWLTLNSVEEVMLVPSMGIMGCVEYDDSSGCHLLIEVEPFKFLEYLSFQYTVR